MMESWVLRLAGALKNSLRDVNVVISDWVSLAHQHYPIAVQSTRTVGKDIAHLLESLQVRGGADRPETPVAPPHASPHLGSPTLNRFNLNMPHRRNTVTLLKRLI